MWISRAILLLLLVNALHAFKFKEESEEIVPTKEAKESQREEKKIDPLVVDVDRKPIEEPEKTEETSEEQPEGRFFLKDKLCALGLADVSVVYYLLSFTNFCID